MTETTWTNHNDFRMNKLKQSAAKPIAFVVVAVTLATGSSARFSMVAPHAYSQRPATP